jgi:hypothetical protein
MALEFNALHLRHGEHRLALQAAEAAVVLDPGHPTARQQADTISKLITAQH